MQTHHTISKSKNGLATAPKPATDTHAANFTAPGDRPAEKPNGLSSQQFLSQGSIAHYVEDAELETQQERKRLALQVSERKQFANAIISQTSHQMENGEPGCDESGPNQSLVF